MQLKLSGLRPALGGPLFVLGLDGVGVRSGFSIEDGLALGGFGGLDDVGLQLLFPLGGMLARQDGQHLSNLLLR